MPFHLLSIFLSQSFETLPFLGQKKTDAEIQKNLNRISSLKQLSSSPLYTLPPSLPLSLSLSLSLSPSLLNTISLLSSSLIFQRIPTLEVDLYTNRGMFCAYLLSSNSTSMFDMHNLLFYSAAKLGSQRFCTIYSSRAEAQVELMGHFSSVFNGLAKSFTTKKGRSSDRCSGKEAAEAMAKEAKRNHSILQSSGPVKQLCLSFLQNRNLGAKRT